LPAWGNSRRLPYFLIRFTRYEIEKLKPIIA